MHRSTRRDLLKVLAGVAGLSLAERLRAVAAGREARRNHACRLEAGRGREADPGRRSGRAAGRPPSRPRPRSQLRLPRRPPRPRRPSPRPARRSRSSTGARSAPTWPRPRRRWSSGSTRARRTWRSSTSSRAATRRPAQKLTAALQARQAPDIGDPVRRLVVQVLPEQGDRPARRLHEGEQRRPRGLCRSVHQRGHPQGPDCLDAVRAQHPALLLQQGRSGKRPACRIVDLRPGTSSSPGRRSS